MRIGIRHEARGNSRRSGVFSVEFIVNLKATKQIDLTIPLKVLARAERVIK